MDAWARDVKVLLYRSLVLNAILVLGDAIQRSYRSLVYIGPYIKRMVLLDAAILNYGGYLL